jgi:hypothetical protein
MEGMIQQIMASTALGPDVSMDVEISRYTKKVKLKLWELVIVFINNFILPLTYDYATLRQSVAGNSTFRGIIFCNLGTPKPVIPNFVTMRQIETPYLSP